MDVSWVEFSNPLAKICIGKSWNRRTRDSRVEISFKNLFWIIL